MDTMYCGVCHNFGDVRLAIEFKPVDTQIGDSDVVTSGVFTSGVYMWFVLS